MKQTLKALLPATLRCWMKDKWHYLRHLRFMGGRLRLNFPDRILLEDVILAHLAQDRRYQRILFIGCDWYTKNYPCLFANREFWTIEIDPAKARFGGQHHIIDGLQNLTRHAGADFFDAFIHTGVFGWGIDTRELADETFDQCHRCLKPGGMLVFGWDDVPAQCPFAVTEECAALKRFETYIFPPLGVHRHLVADSHLRHTFAFYQKPRS
ncbi:MAG: hypothetical protein JNG86_17000 [Verrucomicrobiaceae bacterium]|nr:hypothetical protein [Verrucomicrobiaceae bacterium]